MFARYHIRANRRAKLQGQQLDITFPRRGRPSKFRRLERAGQMRLSLDGAIRPNYTHSPNVAIEQNLADSLQMMLSTAITPDNPITDADVPF
jgi:hypothetical protein